MLFYDGERGYCRGTAINYNQFSFTKLWRHALRGYSLCSRGHRLCGSDWRDPELASWRAPTSEGQRHWFARGSDTRLAVELPSASHSYKYRKVPCAHIFFLDCSPLGNPLVEYRAKESRQTPSLRNSWLTFDDYGSFSFCARGTLLGGCISYGSAAGTSRQLSRFR